MPYILKACKVKVNENLTLQTQNCADKIHFTLIWTTKTFFSLVLKTSKVWAFLRLLHPSIVNCVIQGQFVEGEVQAGDAPAAPYRAMSRSFIFNFMFQFKAPFSLKLICKWFYKQLKFIIYYTVMNRH